MSKPRCCLRLAVPIAMSIGLILAAAASPALAQGAAAPPVLNLDKGPLGPPAPSPLKPGDAFGETVTLPERTIVFMKGHTNWDAAFDTLTDAFKSLNEYLDKQGIKPNGPFITIYTQTDDTGFSFQAAAPVASAPANPPKGDIAVGTAPGGKALKFVHRGSYDAMDSTYEAITNYLDDKQLEAKDLFIEEYTTDPVKTDPNSLVINVFVPIK
ncbi:MAG: GyrI-like domain-containing protein [Pseudolabrys sp.]|nr:GyrI-like domain-containing protein [Pseudolabrys sp.]